MQHAQLLSHVDTDIVSQFSSDGSRLSAGASAGSARGCLNLRRCAPTRWCT
jgi:hypothetical protein